MKRKCPNNLCTFYQLPSFVQKDGFYFRKNDSRKIQRYKCKNCNKKFSSSTGTLEYNQKKRRINYQLKKLLCSKNSERRAAFLLRISRHTVARRVKYLGKKAKLNNEKRLKRIQKISNLQMDDLITKENSKLKPISVSLAVCSNTGTILGGKASQIPSFGHLVKIARKKYGFRECFHKRGLNDLFRSISKSVEDRAEIRTDKHKKYPVVIKKYLPNARHLRFKGERSCVAGQGELKKVKFDPLFKINHTCALFRDNINRLVKKTWCTTKSIVRLQDFIEMFIDFFNTYLLPRRKKKRGKSPL